MTLASLSFSGVVWGNAALWASEPVMEILNPGKTRDIQKSHWDLVHDGTMFAPADSGLKPLIKNDPNSNFLSKGWKAAGFFGQSDAEEFLQ